MYLSIENLKHYVLLIFPGINFHVNIYRSQCTCQFSFMWMYGTVLVALFCHSSFFLWPPKTGSWYPSSVFLHQFLGESSTCKMKHLDSEFRKVNERVMIYCFRRDGMSNSAFASDPTNTCIQNMDYVVTSTILQQAYQFWFYFFLFWFVLFECNLKIRIWE